MRTVLVSVILLLVTVWPSARATYNVTAYCSLVKKGTKLPSTETCGKFYTCWDAGYSEHSCDDDYSFDKDLQACQPADKVDCFYGIANPCRQKEASFVPQVGTCRGWIYCEDNVELGRGDCAAGTVFKDGQCVYGTCASEDDESKSEASNICAVMPANIFFGNTVDCKQFQICREESADPRTGSCTDGFLYDTRIALCNYELATDCSRVTDLDKRHPMQNQPCTEEGATVSSAVRCSDYYSCRDGQWRLQSCGDLFWDTERSECVSRLQATPNKDCDRCEGTVRQFANTVDSKCAGYFVCDSGKAVASGACRNGYFDESVQACIASGGDLDAYRRLNGACTPLEDICECGQPDEKTKQCERTPDCPCGLKAANSEECVVCSSEVDPDTGICRDDECVCQNRDTDECAQSEDDCNCGLDEQDECVECTDGTVENGICVKKEDM